jgi:hypothetical protein
MTPHKKVSSHAPIDVPEPPFTFGQLVYRKEQPTLPYVVHSISYDTGHMHYAGHVWYFHILRNYTDGPGFCSMLVTANDITAG